MCSIAVNALYTTLRKRGTTRQLTGAIITCVISALFLLPTLFWYNLRFVVHQEMPPTKEVEVVLAWIAFCGWLLPLGATTIYFLFSLPRTGNTASRIPSQKQPQAEQQNNPTSQLSPPRYQPGVVAPFAYEDDAPWGWLEYSSGNFQGQRLALKRTIAMIGRDEDCDIWLDDDMASRYHAELAWTEEQVYLTDCGSLNGVLRNGQRVHGSILLQDKDTISIGSHHFIFVRAEHKIDPRDNDDPLNHHTWRSTQDLLSESIKRDIIEMDRDQAILQSSSTHQRGALTFCDGTMVGHTVQIDRPMLTVGRDPGCDIVITDSSISPQHAQFVSQSEGDYVQDLSSSYSTTVNSEILLNPRRLQPGDIVGFGNLHLIYVIMSPTPNTTQPGTITPQSYPSMRSGPIPLRLPSRYK